MANKEKKVKVLFFVAELPPFGGGVATSAENILKRIKLSDCLEVDVITQSFDGKYKVYALGECVRVYGLPGKRIHKNELHNQKTMRVLWYLFISYFFTWKKILERRYDLSCFFGYPGGFIGLLFLWNMPYVVSLQGLETPGYNPKFKKWYVLYTWFAKIIFRKAAIVTACSGELAKLANKTEKNVRVTIITTGVDVEKIRVCKESQKYKKFTVTAGGTRMASIKRLQDLVWGFAMLSKKFDDVSLMLYGSGEMEIVLKKMVRDLGIASRVIFAGNVSREYLYKNLGRCHVMVLPSLNEGMSNAVLGAMAASLPLILTRVGGYRQLVKNNGFLVDKESPKQIFDALLKIYKNKNMRIEMGKESRLIAEKFDWDIVSKKYVNVLKKFA